MLKLCIKKDDQIFLNESFNPCDPVQFTLKICQIKCSHVPRKTKHWDGIKDLLLSLQNCEFNVIHFLLTITQALQIKEHLANSDLEAYNSIMFGKIFYSIVSAHKVNKYCTSYFTL